MTGIEGLSLSKEEVDFIHKENIGGIFLSSQNFYDPSQFAELINSIQKLRDEYPLFISINLEELRTNYFKRFFTQFPTMMELAQFNSPKLIFEVYEVIAKELRACGVNQCFSPSCNISINSDNKLISDNSFGVDAQSVEKFISATIRGLQTNGIIACGKHFPGHGISSKNSYSELPIIKTSQKIIKERELIPFIKAVKSRVEFLMMGHLLVDEIDQKYPSSLSPKAYELLRMETKFTKVTITDDLNCKTITDRFSSEHAALQAMMAGADVLLNSSMDMSKKSLLFIRESVKKREIKKEIMLEKIHRVERSKKDFLSGYTPVYIPKISEYLNSPQAKKVTDQISLQQSNALQLRRV
jgi:beta-N-acetylhexosaminidase